MDHGRTPRLDTTAGHSKARYMGEVSAGESSRKTVLFWLWEEARSEGGALWGEAPRHKGALHRLRACLCLELRSTAREGGRGASGTQQVKRCQRKALEWSVCLEWEDPAGKDITWVWPWAEMELELFWNCCMRQFWNRGGHQSGTASILHPSFLCDWPLSTVYTDR